MWMRLWCSTSWRSRTFRRSPDITSLVTSIALYAYGTGAVKGFAVTLGIGIVVSMITAIWGTHGMFDYFMRRIEKSNNTRFWFGYRRK